MSKVVQRIYTCVKMLKTNIDTHCMPKEVEPRSPLNTTIWDILAKYPMINAIKMDIEGIEIDLLEAMDKSDFAGINKLVYEYSFDIDKSIKRFMAIVKKLRTIFKMVHYTKVKQDEEFYDHFPRVRYGLLFKMNFFL